MKEKIKEYKDKLIKIGTIGVITAGAIVTFKCGSKFGYQAGCNDMFYHVLEEFPELKLGDFIKKYRH